MKKTEILTNGLVKENPVLRLVLGTCPTLAVTTAAMNGNFNSNVLLSSFFMISNL